MDYCFYSKKRKESSIGIRVVYSPRYMDRAGNTVPIFYIVMDSSLLLPQDSSKPLFHSVDDLSSIILNRKIEVHGYELFLLKSLPIIALVPHSSAHV